MVIGRSWWVLVLFGVIAVAFGIISLVSPAATAVAMVWAFGVMAIAEGVISLFALITGNSRISRGWLALYALSSLAFGVLAVLNPVQMAGILLLLLAAWLLIAGVFRIALAIRIRKHIRGEWLIALSGLLVIALAVLFVAYPLAGLAAIAIWIGLGALLYGALQIWVGLKLRRFARRL